MAKIHYIAMAGLRGYLPNYCEVYPSVEDAIASLLFLHEIQPGRTEEEDLVQSGFAGLDLQEHGNEYMEVLPCFCDSPQDHSEHEIDMKDFV